MRKARGVILPFPGGTVRTGSKVGAKHYRTLARPSTMSTARRCADALASRANCPMV
jgi:formylmethanofuran:tetrahydromethanopterin formyltransferase